MDARALRARLLEGDERALGALSTLHASRRLPEALAFVAILAAGVALAIAGLALDGARAWLLLGCGMTLAAVAFNAFLLLTHEAHHGLLAARPVANRLLALLFALPLLHAPTAYRVLHVAHHRHLGHAGDPDDYHNYSRNPRVIWLLHWMRLTIGPFLYLALIPLAAARRATRRERVEILAEYAALGSAWAALFALVPFDVLLVAWLLPLVPVGYFTSIRGLAQHGLTDPDDAALSARSFRAGRLVSFLLLNENYHLEHHLFPEVPSYHLPALHALVAPRLPRAVVGTSYLGFLAAFVRRSFTLDESPLGVMEARS